MTQVCSVFIDLANSNHFIDPVLIKTCLSKIRTQFTEIPIYYSGLAQLFAFENEKCSFIESKNQVNTIKSILMQHGKSEQDSLALFYHCYPFFDADLSDEALQRHNKYLAHLTFGENIPLGFLPDYLSLEFIRLLPDDLQTNIREFVFKNIETYDLELVYKLPDLRQLRLDLSTSSSRSTRMINDILKLTGDLKYAGLKELLSNHPEVIRPYPSCFEIELTGQRHLHPVYKPQIESEDLSFELFEKLITDISQNGLKNDSTILFSGAGDALLYPRIEDAISLASKSSNVCRIILETWMTVDDISILESIFNVDNHQKLSIIIRLGSINSAIYKKLYGVDSLKHVLQNIKKIEQLLDLSNSSPPDVYVEMLRMKENDTAVDEFMKYFEESSVKPILGKYNSFINELPDRRAIDLTPLNRDFCWHLTRDFYLNISGFVPVCKQDPGCKIQTGYDFGKFSVGEIFEKIQPAFEASFNGKHDQTGMPCLNCDEWYTFNM